MYVMLQKNPFPMIHRSEIIIWSKQKVIRLLIKLNLNWEKKIKLNN